MVPIFPSPGETSLRYSRSNHFSIIIEKIKKLPADCFSGMADSLITNRPNSRKFSPPQTFYTMRAGLKAAQKNSDQRILNEVVPSPARVHTLLAYTPSPLVLAYGYYSLKKIDIFCKLLSINEPQTTLQNKLLCEDIGKCQIKTPRRALRIEVALSNCTGEMGMDKFRCLNSSYFTSIL